MPDSEPVEAMRRRILRDAEEEAQRIISEAERKALEILEQVKSDMEKREEEEKREVIERMLRNKRERVAEERMERHRRLQSYKSEIIKSVFDEAIRRLEEYCESGRYRETLKRLIAEAGVALGGGDLTFSLNFRDKKIVDEEFVKEVVEKIEDKTETKTYLKFADDPVRCVGGAIVSKADGSASVNNTFEERLNRLREEALSELETILFR